MHALPDGGQEKERLLCLLRTRAEITSGRDCGHPSLLPRPRVGAYYTLSADLCLCIGPSGPLSPSPSVEKWSMG